MTLLGNVESVDVPSQPQPVSSSPTRVFVGASCAAFALVVAGVAVSSSGGRNVASFAAQKQGGVNFVASNE